MITTLKKDIAMALNLRAAFFSKVQTWWNLDVRSHIYDYIKHTISDMHLPPSPPHTKSTYVSTYMA